jgi:hypothetical protein
MTFELTIFIIGGVGSLSVLLFKYIEIKRNRTVILSSITEKTEHHFEGLRNKIVTFIRSINRHNLHNIFVNIVHSAFVAWHKLVRAIKDKLLEFDYIRKVVDAVKGKYQLNHRREASKFLNDISVEKKDKI